MSNKKYKSLSTIIIIVIVVTTILTILAVIFCFFNIFKNTNDKFFVQERIVNNIGNNNSSSTPAVKFSSSKQQVRCYSIKIVKEEGREKEYQLDDVYKAKMKISNNDCNKLELTINNNAMIIEDSLLLSDFKSDITTSFTFNFYRVGDYLTFTNHDNTDLRITHLYVADKSGNIEDIYELDKNNYGMVIESIEFIDNLVIIQSTRRAPDGTIIYNGKNSSDKSIADSIPKNTPVDAIYTYSVDSKGNISFDNPEIKVKTTYQDYLNKK